MITAREDKLCIWMGRIEKNEHTNRAQERENEWEKINTYLPTLNSTFEHWNRVSTTTNCLSSCRNESVCELTREWQWVKTGNGKWGRCKLKWIVYCWRQCVVVGQYVANRHVYIDAQRWRRRRAKVSKQLSACSVSVVDTAGQQLADWSVVLEECNTSNTRIFFIDLSVRCSSSC